MALPHILQFLRLTVHESEKAFIKNFLTQKLYVCTKVTVLT